VFRAVRLVVWCALALATTTRAHAQTPDYHGKLTVGLYDAGDVSSLDVNLRYSVGAWTGWVGDYRGDDHVRQSRGGVEYDLKRRWLFLAPSIQAASGRFVGGSMYSEVGDRIYAIAGVSRTNLRPYVNLNFDPNDSWQLGIGGPQLAVQRQHLGQILRARPPGRRRRRGSIALVITHHGSSSILAAGTTTRPRIG